jgi:glycosyltransferase involved in cell wall biosynthesis
VNTISLSVILAVRNEGPFIEQSLTELLNQDIDYRKVEILVADGCSDDNTRQKVADICSRYPDRQIRFFSNPQKLQYAGVNRMVQLSRGRYLLIVDGHSRFPSDFLAANLECMQSGIGHVAGGLWETAAGDDTAIARAIAACLTTRFGVGNARFRVGGPTGEVDGVIFPCVDRTAFEQLGLFREELLSNADTEFYSRVRANGYKISFDKRIRSVYFARRDLSAIARQMFRNGKWFAYHLSMAQPRHAAPFLFILANVGLLMGGFVLPALWAVWGALALAYVAMALLSAFTCVSDRIQIGARERLLMPLCYLVMHLSYGAGWIFGFATGDTRRARRSIRHPAPDIHTPLSGQLEEAVYVHASARVSLPG